MTLQFQSTPLMRGETPISLPSISAFGFQSTPLMRGETRRLSAECSASEFQSTPLMRGETYQTATNRAHHQHFNPLPSCEGRLNSQPFPTCSPQFQSTPLMRGETPARVLSSSTRIISIHSPHARGDWYGCAVCLFCKNFNPLPSCEGRRIFSTHICHTSAFQSTPLMRGETA